MPFPGRRPFVLAVAAILSLGAGASAQCPPGAPMPTDLASLSADPVDGSPAHVRWTLGRKAIDGGDLATAREHLRAALALHPCSAAVLLDLLRASAGDADLLSYWTDRFVRAATGPRGRLKLDGQTKKLLPDGVDLGPAQKLAQQRAGAIAELARFAQKQRPSGGKNAARAQLLAYASELLLAIGDGTPGPLDEVADKVRRARAAIEPDYDEVFDALERVMRATPTGGGGGEEDATAIEERALRAARILAGLARQATFKDLQGPQPPDMTAIGRRAREFLAGKDADAQGEAKVWTVAELEALDEEQRVQFTDSHDTWRRPGVAESLTGKYRIETICGFETLLGTARTIELHHDRLAGHFGKDPFGSRQGIVRIVPEDSGLETEGAPYWWAAGFQSGDRTTVRFAWSTIPRLGRVLTHELTHRFDGVLRPFLGAWYKEGHASWTGGHYAQMADTEFVEDHLDKGAVDQTWRKDYGRKREFTKLIEGTIEEYRDNYSAGYALYSYLRTFPPGERPLFRDALERYEKNSRAGQKNPLRYFEQTFCDGENGRPESLDDFLDGWQAFLNGVGMWLVRNRDDSNRWVARYGSVGPGDSGKKVSDRPTWSWARKRAEPFFGQDHAAAATRLLAEVGDHAGTVAAGTWSLTVDGWRPDTVTRAVHAAQQLPSKSSAHAITALARTRFPGIGSPPATPLASQLARTSGFVTALAERAVELGQAGHSKAATALAAEHDRIARLLDLPALDRARLQSAAATTPPPPVAEYLGGHGWTESGLTGFEDRRREGLWYVERNGDVHVGRARPRETTGSVDRRAHQRDAFVHTVRWIAPGSYVLRGRVHFTTSYVRGAIVFGHARRDRDLRLRFTSGDFEYAVGRRETSRASGKVSFRFDGLWERDPEMPRNNTNTSAEVRDEAAWFDYEIVVHGPRVEIKINDGKRKSILYAVHDGAPIEGHVGFAMAMGAIRVQEPTVQRLDVADPDALIGLDIGRQPTRSLTDLLDLPTRGLPTAPDGTIVVWIPPGREELADMTMPRVLPTLREAVGEAHEHPQEWVLVVPEGLPAEDRAAITKQLADVRGPDLRVLTHTIDEPFDGRYPWVLFVDGLGVLRAAASAASPHLFTKVARWSRRFRGR